MISAAQTPGAAPAADRRAAPKADSTAELPLLWHLKISNFNEKARWALDYKGIAHRRIALPPVAHILVAFALTRRNWTLPVLKIDGKTIGDSTNIIAALEERSDGPPLYPTSPADRQRALELEEFFDENLGADVRCVILDIALGSPEFRDLVPAPVATVLRRRHGISKETAAQSRLKIRAALHLIADLLDGRAHLVGGQFSVADLTAAALLAPLVGPPQLPYQDLDIRLPSELVRLGGECRASNAGAWVLRTYEAYRPVSAEVRPGESTADTEAGQAKRGAK